MSWYWLLLIIIISIIVGILLGMFIVASYVGGAIFEGLNKI